MSTASSSTASSPTLSYELCEPKWNIHSFSDLYMDNSIFFQLITLKDSLFVWIGDKDIKMESLSLALLSAVDDNKPIVTSFFSKSGISSSLSQRLAKQSGHPVYVSYNLTANDRILEGWVEKKLLKEIKALKSLSSFSASSSSSSSLLSSNTTTSSLLSQSLASFATSTLSAVSSSSSSSLSSSSLSSAKKI
eukprot:TRINITY_DN7533_c0_g1_i1.p1 TRINITY_DN7533_c0_g1~~TRINITY_DN7533_c0_g1_i1.p1  ORF type:complete len:192 (-),score=89.24 TRINITY_DN7533_c0_g1_i1:171-746(-)